MASSTRTTRPRRRARPAASRTETVGFRGRLAGKASGRPEARARQSRARGHASQRGERGRQTSAPSSISAWLWSPGDRRFRNAAAAASTAAREAPVAGVAGNGVETREDAGDVPVQGRDRNAERDGGDGGGGVRADAREGAQLLHRTRDGAAPFLHETGRAVEVPRAGVVAEAAPFRQDVPLLGGRERGDGREAGEEALPARDAGGDGRLLEDRLGDPDGPRVARPAEGKVAALAPVPPEERGAQGRQARRRERRTQSCCGEDRLARRGAQERDRRERRSGRKREEGELAVAGAVGVEPGAGHEGAVGTLEDEGEPLARRKVPAEEGRLPAAGRDDDAGEGAPFRAAAASGPVSRRVRRRSAGRERRLKEACRSRANSPRRASRRSFRCAGGGIRGTARASAATTSGNASRGSDDERFGTHRISRGACGGG